MTAHKNTLNWNYLLPAILLSGISTPFFSFAVTPADESRKSETSQFVFPKEEALWPGGAKSKEEFLVWQKQMREKLAKMLGLPAQKAPLASERRGESERDGIIIERWVFTSEPGSRVPVTLFRPQAVQGKMPAIVLTYGHGGSKSAWSYNYAAQMYAKLGLAVLAIDPIGEDERSANGKAIGTREHDRAENDKRARNAKRLIMGKLVFDTMRGIDFLCERADIDSEKIGVMGHSLGGAVSSWMAALEPRVKMALVCGWAYDDILATTSKLCTRFPNSQMRTFCSWSEYASLTAPNCAILVMNGDADTIIDLKGDRSTWISTKSVAGNARRVYQQLNSKADMQCWFESNGGHRPYFLYKVAVHWVNRYLGTPSHTSEEIAKLPEINSGDWCDANNIKLERLYGTKLHDRGATIIDFQLRPTASADLKCLKSTERGSNDFTIHGWLDTIEAVTNK